MLREDANYYIGVGIALLALLSAFISVWVTIGFVMAIFLAAIIGGWIKNETLMDIFCTASFAFVFFAAIVLVLVLLIGGLCDLVLLVL